MRIDPETFAFFCAAGHLTRIAEVLKTHAQSHREPSEPTERWQVASAEREKDENLS